MLPSAPLIRSCGMSRGMSRLRTEAPGKQHLSLHRSPQGRRTRRFPRSTEHRLLSMKKRKCSELYVVAWTSVQSGVVGSLGRPVSVQSEVSVIEILSPRSEWYSKKYKEARNRSASASTSSTQTAEGGSRTVRHDSGLIFCTHNGREDSADPQGESTNS